VNHQSEDANQSHQSIGENTNEVAFGMMVCNIVHDAPPAWKIRHELQRVNLLMQNRPEFNNEESEINQINKCE
jgi:hypothetical protein